MNGPGWGVRLAGLLSWWLQGYFARLACLMVGVAICSHVLALSLLFGLGPPPPPGSPAGGAPAGMWLDIGVRLGAVLVATWVGARWLSRPLQRLARSTQALASNIHAPPLPETGAREIREASVVVNQLQQHILAQLADRDRFVAAVSHDLRTPLTRLALRTEGLESATDRERFHKDIREMDRMITATLDHLQGTASPEPVGAVDLLAMVQSAVDDCQETGQPVQWSPSTPPPTQPLHVTGQASGMRRCLDNLLTNAVRYGRQAWVHLDVTPLAVCVVVSDQGPGIPEAELERVLQPFVQLGTNGLGVGMGLATTRSIAQQHGGSLVLRNNPGGGLRAELTWPRSAL